MSQEIIKSGKYYRVYDGENWNRMHFVTDANSVLTDDGGNLETKLSEINASLGGLRFGTDGDGNMGYYGADGSLIPFSSGGGNSVCIGDMELVLSEMSYNQDYITVTVPDDIEEGMLVSVCSAGSAFKVLHDITGDGITNSEVLYENRVGLAHGVTTAVRVLKCKFSSGKTIKSGWNNTGDDYNSHFVLIFKQKHTVGRISQEIEIVPLVPKLISTNKGSDGGEASAGGTRSGDVYYLFDQIPSTHCVLSVAPGNDLSYFQYRFAAPTVVNRVEFNNYWSDTNPINTITSFIIQGSNDGSTFDDIYTGTHTGSPNTTDIATHEFENNKTYLYYRFKIMTSGEGASYGSLRTLQFYGYHMEALVPAPNGEAITSGDVTNAHLAFNGNSSDCWAGTKASTGNWIGYKFAKPVNVEMITIYGYAGYNSTARLEYSDDGTTWNNTTTTLEVAKAIPLQAASVSDYGAHSYWRIYQSASASMNSFHIAEFQFYASPEPNYIINVEGGGDVSIADMPTETYEGTCTKNTKISFTPECSIDKVQMICVSGRIVAAGDTVYNGIGVYIVKDGSICETIISQEVSCEIVDGVIQYGQTRTGNSTKMTCEVYYTDTAPAGETVKVKYANGTVDLKTTATTIDTGLDKISTFIIDNGQESVFGYYNGKVIYDNYDCAVLDSVEGGKITLHYTANGTFNWYACGTKGAPAGGDNDYSSMVSLQATSSAVSTEYKCIKDTTALLTMWGNSYNSGNSISINGNAIFLHSGSTDINDFQQVDLKKGDTIKVSLNAGSANRGTTACIFHNGGIY